MYKERETKFFVVKSFDQTNLDLAKEHNAWVTGPVNKIRFDEAFDVSQGTGLDFFNAYKMSMRAICERLAKLGIKVYFRPTMDHFVNKDLP